MLMPRRLECHLDMKQVPYSMIFHAPADSAQMAASAMHLPGKEVAKAVALQAGGREILAVLPACYRINFEKLSAIVGEPVRLMDEEGFSELFADCERGDFALRGTLRRAGLFGRSVGGRPGNYSERRYPFGLCAHGE